MAGTLDWPALALGWSMAVVRIWAILRVQVLWRRAIGPVWELVAPAAALGLGFLCVPGGSTLGARISQIPMSSLAGLTGVDMWIALGFEAALGTAMGLLTSLPGHALMGAGTESSKRIGLGAADGSSGFVTLFASLGLLAGLLMSAHQPALLGLRESVQIFPLGLPAQWLHWGTAEVVGELGMAAHAVLSLAFALATPVLLVSAVAETFTRLLSGGPVAMVAIGETILPWARLTLALAGLVASWATFPGSWAAGIGSP